MDQRPPYLFFDTETGGVDASQHSLLSLGLVVGDGSQIAAQTEIFIRHDPYVVTAGGLEVNGIDLVTHHTWALAPMEAWVEMNTFLSAHFAPDEPIILVGHNISFDRAFLEVFLRGLGQGGSRRFSHRSIDTHAVAAGLEGCREDPSHRPPPILRLVRPLPDHHPARAASHGPRGRGGDLSSLLAPGGTGKMISTHTSINLFLEP